MKVLVAEDDEAMRQFLARLIVAIGHEVLQAADGEEALNLALGQKPEILVTDWMMPKLDGLELCARLRALGPGHPYVYIILLTARDRKEDILRGLEAGADDYVVKPFDREELVARVRVGERIVRLETLLRSRNEELENSLLTIRKLKSLLPICMFCKKIRTDGNYWEQIEAYVHEQTGTDFSHGVCPDCLKKQYPEHYARVQGQNLRREENLQDDPGTSPA